jgi:hypothetical protein
MLFSKIFTNGTNQKAERRKAEYYRNRIRQEAIIGGQLFGPVPAGGKREFFCLDERTWIWHEEWVDQNNQVQVKTTRYDVRPNGILKAQNGQGYQYITPEESQHLIEAAQMYRQRVRTELYNLPA